MTTIAEALDHGWKLHQSGAAPQALAIYQRVLEQYPQNANAWCYAGIAFFDLKRMEESEEAYRRALAQQPEFPVAWSNLANTLSALGRHDEAIACCETALQQKPDYVTAMSNLGAIYVKLARFSDATDIFRRATAAAPDDSRFRRHLGAALVRAGEPGEAQLHSREALKLNPRDAEAHKNLGLVQLLQEQFEDGWAEYEWRWRTGDLPLPEFPQPLWGGEPLEGRTLLLHAEQGLGDTLQFVRFAPLLAERGARVIVMCQPPLAPLLRSCPGIEQLVARSEPIPHFDVHLPMLSCGRVLKIHAVDQIPANIPYLAAAPERVARWRRRLDARLPAPRFCIGIVWQGSAANQADVQRSAPLLDFLPLAEAPGVQLVSLQKVDGLAQLDDCGDLEILDFGESLDRDGAFLDTAALIQCLDLVICTDTSVAHLAGALGAPVWIALNKAADWRWLLDREDSPWYPSVRLFRQSELGDWKSVFTRMAAELPPLIRRAGKDHCRSVAIRVSPGELLDKLTILEIKSERIAVREQLDNVALELAALRKSAARSIPPSAELTGRVEQLKAVNQRLWDIEDEIRLCESRAEFGGRFIELARAVYHENDRRAALKRDINSLLGAEWLEEKSYQDY